MAGHTAGPRRKVISSERTGVELGGTVYYR
jgi:hypothetical protein